MRKLFYFLAMSAIVLGMAFTFNACGGNDANNPEEPNNPEKTVFDNDYFHVEVSVKEAKYGQKPIMHIKIAPKSTVYKYIMAVSSKFYADNAWGSAQTYLKQNSNAINTNSHYNTGTPIEYDDSDRKYDTEYVVILFGLNDKNEPIEETWTKAPFKTPAEPEPKPIKDALSGKFTVDENGKQVQFSNGNPQASTTDLGANWTWGFAEHQWDIVGNAAANNAISGNKTVSSNGTVDLFGWSTAATYYGINNSKEGSDYSGKFKDWGETIGEGWYTLSMAEWAYLFLNRTDASTKCGFASVADVNGLIILPDIYEGPAINLDHSAWSDNPINASDWSSYEAAGAVFLPAAGNRYGTGMYVVGSFGEYWSSTPSPYGEYDAYASYFSDKLPHLAITDRNGGISVRLVKEVK